MVNTACAADSSTTTSSTVRMAASPLSSSSMVPMPRLSVIVPPTGVDSVTAIVSPNSASASPLALITNDLVASPAANDNVGMVIPTKSVPETAEEVPDSDVLTDPVPVKGPDRVTVNVIGVCVGDDPSITRTSEIEYVVGSTSSFVITPAPTPSARVASVGVPRLT